MARTLLPSARRRPRAYALRKAVFADFITHLRTFPRSYNNSTLWSFIIQSRPDMPDEVGGRVWYGPDAPLGSVWLPVYAATPEVSCCVLVACCALKLISLL